MIVFIFLSGKQITFNNFKQYKYFYHTKAYILDKTEYCYCNLTYNDKNIKDFEKINNYISKIITVVKINIYNYKLKN